MLHNKRKYDINVLFVNAINSYVAYDFILYVIYWTLYTTYELTLELPIVNTKLFLPKPVKMTLKNTY